MSEFRHIVRIAGKDVSGAKRVSAGLGDIRGVGNSLAQTITGLLKIDPKLRLGWISDQQIAELNAALKDPKSIGVPVWQLNRRKELDTGGDVHRIGSDLEFTVKSDIEREKTIRSWKGVRHSLGLKVRGQRTRTAGRTNRTVGVRKATLIAAASAKRKEETPAKR